MDIKVKNRLQFKPRRFYSQRTSRISFEKDVKAN